MNKHQIRGDGAFARATITILVEFASPDTLLTEPAMQRHLDQLSVINYLMENGIKVALAAESAYLLGSDVSLDRMTAEIVLGVGEWAIVEQQDSPAASPKNQDAAARAAVAGIKIGLMKAD